MSEAATIRVVVAAGKTVTIAPHPSGLRELPPLTLYGGAVVRLPAARAEKLIASGTVLDPATGVVRPPPQSTPPIVQQFGGSYEDMARRAEEAKVSAPVTLSMPLDGWRRPEHIEPSDPLTTGVHLDFSRPPR